MGTEKQPNEGGIMGLWEKAQQAGLTRRKFLALLAVGGATAVLAACTKSIPSPLPTTSSTTRTTTAAPSTTAKPATTSTPITSPSPTINKYGGTLRINWATQSGQFGYPLNFKGAAHNFAKPCLEGLLRRSNQLGVYMPLLAESWDLAPDKSSYTFHLRKGIKFHDGTDFSAAAVKWNLDKVLTGQNALLLNVKSFDIIDDYTIKATLKAWDVLTLDDFAEPLCAIYSPPAFEKNGVGWADTHPIGTGAFVFKQYEQGQFYKYEKNPNYWNKSLPYLDAIVINYIKDPVTAKLSMMAGDLDLIREVDVDSATELVATGKLAEEHLPVGHFIMYFDGTSSNSLWSNKKLREALEYGIDKESIAKGLGKGFAVPIYEIIFSMHDLGDPGTTPRKYDPAKARQLLAEAGYPNGGIKVELNTNQKFNTPHIVAIQDNLAKIGIQIDIVPMTDAAWQEENFKLPQNNKLRYDRQRGGALITLPYTKLELSAGSLYFQGAKRPDGWNAMLANVLKEADPAKQVPLLAQMEKLAYNDVMFIPLWGLAEIEVFVPKLKSDIMPRFFVGGQADWINLKYFYFEK